MAESTEDYFNQPRGLLFLWAGVLAGPVAWALSQQVAYLLATLDCSHGFDFALSPVMIVTLLVAAGGIAISWHNWQQLGAIISGEEGDPLARSRFLAMVGLLLSSFSALVIVAEWLPIFFYRQCQR